MERGLQAANGRANGRAEVNNRGEKGDMFREQREAEWDKRGAGDNARPWSGLRTPY